MEVKSTVAVFCTDISKGIEFNNVVDQLLIVNEKLKNENLWFRIRLCLMKLMSFVLGLGIVLSVDCRWRCTDFCNLSICVIPRQEALHINGLLLYNLLVVRNAWHLYQNSAIELNARAIFLFCKSYSFEVWWYQSSSDLQTFD